MRLLFWRKKGRHALGAAVTAIPSAPVQAAQAAQAAQAVQAAEEPEPSLPAGEPDLLTSIAQLIATGEAWAEPGERVARVAPRAEPAHVAVPVRPADDDVPAVVPEPAVPVQPAVPAQPTPRSPAPRVQLGFRDGTTTTLDPSSSQSQALEQLAQSLTRRD